MGQVRPSLNLAAPHFIAWTACEGTSFAAWQKPKINTTRDKYRQRKRASIASGRGQSKFKASA
jgi:hypothetical protein